jgi:hypothetical protein
MAPKEKQKIEIKKTHRDPFLSFNQAVTVDCSDFLGTALIRIYKCSQASSAEESLKCCAALFAVSTEASGFSVMGNQHCRRREQI